MKNLQIEALEIELKNLSNMISSTIRTIDAAEQQKQDAEKKLSELNETYYQKIREMNELTDDN